MLRPHTLVQHAEGGAGGSGIQRHRETAGVVRDEIQTLPDQILRASIGPLFQGDLRIPGHVLADLQKKRLGLSALRLQGRKP
jgi:hypothetical protein